jgi:uridine monophosphate synthetase
MLGDEKKSLSLEIFRLGGILFDEKGFRFNLHDKHPKAPLSLSYVNLRSIFRNRTMRIMIAWLLVPFVNNARPDRLVDLPESATPLITTLSNLTGIEMISIRSEALKGQNKDHGVNSMISGYYETGMSALIVDDVVSSFAHTKFKAIKILRESGLIPSSAIGVVVDREEGGREKLDSAGFELKSLLGLHSDITEQCFKAGIVSQKIIEMSTEFAKAAKAYSMAA